MVTPIMENPEMEMIKMRFNRKKSSEFVPKFAS